MAEIPRAALDYVTDQINALSASAQAAVLRVLESVEWAPENVARCRELVVEALRLVLPEYTELAAQASADLYDAIRQASVGEALGASAVSGYDADATEGAVRALVQRVVGGGDVESFNRAVLDRVDYEVKRAAGNSTIENGLADPARVRFARVPTGAETCGFCMMLAGRGFVYLTRESAGEFHHYHAHCDCRVVASFDDSTGVEGYDPGEYLALYSEARSRLGGRPTDGEIAGEMERVLAERQEAERLVSSYEEGVNAAWKKFVSQGKSAEAYQETVGAHLKGLGDSLGIELTGQYATTGKGTLVFARPSGEELWAVSKISDIESSIAFLPSDRSLLPDVLTSNGYAEIKTPKSVRKVTDRLAHAAKQLEAVESGEKRVYLSGVHFDSTDEIIRLC